MPAKERDKGKTQTNEEGNRLDTENTRTGERGTLEIHDLSFDLSKHNENCLKVAFVFMSTCVVAATLVVFFDGLFLIVDDVTTNSKCPLDGEMDCYSRNNTYFFCNSSDTQIDASLGSLTCYRWLKDGTSTVDILNQVGLCAGLIQAFGWLVNLFLRFLFYVFEARKPVIDPFIENSKWWLTFKRKYKHPRLLICWNINSVIFAIVGFPTVLFIPIFAEYVTAITLSILLAAFFISAVALIIFLAGTFATALSTSSVSP
ncbi:unnamed protein product [Didymodactylos carnosus]|uniref:Uncharacterized protein n=1 Tax=Didymodactylos carnosus TaxID=1234261 RepID=A0A815QAE8_9BILA|nr:unnamed protein product [Didymodactylos carnosus]CAF4330344.1 unnamed protein product [Didymodactylos carnosus]